MNLLVNAARKHSRTRKIFVRSGLERDHVWLEIEDTGSGMSDEIRHRIFDPFFTTKPVGKGTGLGLSISYIIVKKHHGWVDVMQRTRQGQLLPHLAGQRAGHRLEKLRVAVGRIGESATFDQFVEIVHAVPSILFRRLIKTTIGTTEDFDRQDRGIDLGVTDTDGHRLDPREKCAPRWPVAHARRHCGRSLRSRRR